MNQKYFSDTWSIGPEIYGAESLVSVMPKGVRVSDVAVEVGIKSVEMSEFARDIYEQKYAFKNEDGVIVEDWSETAQRVATEVLGALGYSEDSLEVKSLTRLITERKFMPGGRYLYASGRPLHQTQNCALYTADDSREGWSDLLRKTSMALMTGAGVGVVYSNVREKGAVIEKTGGLASGPISLMSMVNEVGRHVMQGGSRRSAIWAGLHWNHPDCEEFIKIKNWDKEIRALKEKDFNFPAPMEMTNVSVILDDDFFAAYEDADHVDHELAHKIYRMTVKQMARTAEPGFSIDVGPNAGEHLRNACTEVTSADDSDICNLGSINFANISDNLELQYVLDYAVLFLLAGTVYSDLPHDEIHLTRTKNRRLGLGIMGIHEWLLKRGYKYGPNKELGEWLEIYATSTEVAAKWADLHGLSHPIKTRAIAPTGTIGIIAETTTGIEPIFCVAYKRRYLKGDVWKFQYVVDPTAKRLVDSGVKPAMIEDAYSLSYDVERRVAFQAWVQQYVDHGISSTINIPYPIRNLKELDEFGDMLYKHLPKLRGITVYPDGARGGQPLSVTTYEQAMKHRGVVFEESEERCVGGACGI